MEGAKAMIHTSYGGIQAGFVAKGSLSKWEWTMGRFLLQLPDG